MFLLKAIKLKIRQAELKEAKTPARKGFTAKGQKPYIFGHFLQRQDKSYDERSKQPSNLGLDLKRARRPAL